MPEKKKKPEKTFTASEQVRGLTEDIDWKKLGSDVRRNLRNKTFLSPVLKKVMKDK